jgi:beta-ureidopropionase / N-carbamoyl-L-amino-acid hydrolase
LATISAGRLAERLDAVSRFGATPAGGLDREALTADEVAARRYVLDAARARGFACAADALGSLFIRRPGRDPAKPPILCGSHLDSQPKGGRYDGTLGVMAALEVLECLEDAGAGHAHPIEAVAWTNEEGSRFAPGAMGSQAYAGAADPDALLAARDAAGVSVAEAVAAMRAACGPLGDRPLLAPLAAYLELHIEQGPVLEAEGRSLTVVEGIQGARWLEVRLAGRSGHAGTTPEAMRADAGDAAIRTAAAARAAVAGGDHHVRFTIGRIGFQPGSVNTIPASASFTIDLRHPEEAALDRLEAEVRAAVAGAAAPCTADIVRLMTVAATRFDPRVTEACAEAVSSLGQSPLGMTSGAFHDAQFIARIAPAGMIFIPCRGGISHAEAEAIEPAHAAMGAEALLRAVLLLDGRLD